MTSAGRSMCMVTRMSLCLLSVRRYVTLVDITLKIQREDYQRLLYDRALEPGVNVKFGCKVDSIDEVAPSITLEDGEVLKADLIIGADGMLSSQCTFAEFREIACVQMLPQQLLWSNPTLMFSLVISASFLSRCYYLQFRCRQWTSKSCLRLFL
jgi:hypothetical protein